MKIKVAKLRSLLESALNEELDETWHQFDDIKERLTMVFGSLKQKGFTNDTKEVKSVLQALQLLSKLQATVSQKKYRVR
jgi:hypothetical protein